MGDEISQDSMASILENLNASNNEMMSKIDEGIIATSNPDQQNIDNNVIQQPEISASLSSDEQSRYRNIGQEIFSPILKALDKMLKKNKKKKTDLLGGKEGKEGMPGMGGGAGGAMGGDQGGMPGGGKFDFADLDFEKIFNFGEEITGEILGIVMLLGLGAMMFFMSIGDFFSGIWDWIKEFFAPIGDFFDFSNGPLSGVFSMIGGAIEGLWKLVSGVFKSLAKVGSWIWDGIKKIFTNFITGPNGILSFGTKLVKGIVDFAGKAFSWIGDLLSNVILGPIKAIFGGAEETGKQAGESAVATTSANVDDMVHKQKIAADAATNKAVMSQEEATKSWSNCVAKTREEAAAKAKQMGIQTNKDGTISSDALKNKLAEDYIKQLEEKEGKLHSDEREKLLQTVKNNIKLNGNNLEIDGKALKADVQRMARSLDDANNSDAVDALVDNTDDILGAMNGNISGQAKAFMDIYAKANVANDFDSKTEEEKFLWRMEQAKEQGTLAEFRIAEARSMIVLAIETIKNTFNGFKVHLTDTFKESFNTLSKQIKDNIVINLRPEWINDYSTNSYDVKRITNNGTHYHIMPVKKKDFENTVNQLTTLAETNIEMVSKQNEVLGEIKEILAEGVANPEIKVAVEDAMRAKFGENFTMPEEPSNAPSKDSNQNSEIGKSLRNKLFNVVSAVVD